MRFIIGLGNPGKEYVNTRHNAGCLVVDQLKNHKSSDFTILKTDVFMNDSGSFVKKIVSKHPSIPVSSIYVVHDDLDIKLGEYKIQFGKGPKDHNGILDIEDKLGTKDFWRIRVGIDNRPLDHKPMGEVYTLQNFTDEERIVLDKIIEEICKKLATL